MNSNSNPNSKNNIISYNNEKDKIQVKKGKNTNIIEKKNNKNKNNISNMEKSDLEDKNNKLVDFKKKITTKTNDTREIVAIQNIEDDIINYDIYNHDTINYIYNEYNMNTFQDSTSEYSDEKFERKEEEKESITTKRFTEEPREYVPANL